MSHSDDDALFDAAWQRLRTPGGGPTPEFGRRISIWANASDRKYRSLLYTIGFSVDLDSRASTYRVETFAAKMNDSLRGQGHHLRSVSKSFVERRLRELVHVGLIERHRRKDVVEDVAGRSHFSERPAITIPNFGAKIVDGQLCRHDFFAVLSDESVTDSAMGPEADSVTDSSTVHSSVVNQSTSSSSNDAADVDSSSGTQGVHSQANCAEWWTLESARYLAEILATRCSLPGVNPTILHSQWAQLTADLSSEELFVRNLNSFLADKRPQDRSPGFLVSIFPRWLTEGSNAVWSAQDLEDERLMVLLEQAIERGVLAWRGAWLVKVGDEAKRFSQDQWLEILRTPNEEDELRKSVNSQ